MFGEDLVPLFTPPPGNGVGFRQGVVVAFNKLTLANTIRVGGADLHDLPILGVGETTMLEPGDVVGILTNGPVMAILGQFVIPGTAAAGDAISLTSTNTYSESTSAAETTTSTSFTNLTTVGPVIPDVRIGPSGRCLVFMSAIITVLTAAEGGNMGFEISGATSVSPGDGSKTLGHYGSVNSQLAGTRLWLETGLNAGLHTFTAKYFYGGGAGSVRFSNRNLTVMAL